MRRVVIDATTGTNPLREGGGHHPDGTGRRNTGGGRGEG
jgi:hypothetical protein